MSKRVRIFVDESINSPHGFIASALVFDYASSESSVRAALKAVGLVPGRDEFKSGRRMDTDAVMRELRDRLLTIAGSPGVKLAVVSTPVSERAALGSAILSQLALILRRNGVDPACVDIYFDEGFFPRTERAQQIAAEARDFDAMRFHFEQDSRAVLGLQLADAVAHTVGQVLRQELSPARKEIRLGEGDGYPEGTPADLAFVLLKGLRQTLFHRPAVPEGKEHLVDLRTEPKIIRDDEDPVTSGERPDLLGWGVFVASSLAADLQRVIEDTFRQIFLGCTR